MSDYTPTTEEVLTHFLALPEDRPQVERWLAEVKYQAVREFVESAIKPEKIKELSDMHLAESVRELQAQAWDECGRELMGNAYVDSETYLRNPYRGENK